MLLILRIASLVVAAVGAVLALFGDTQRERRLARLGRLAAVLVLIGFVCSVGIEFVQSKQENLKETALRNQLQRRHEWDLISEYPIKRIMLSFYHRKEMPLWEFAEYLSRMEVSLTIPLAQGATRVLSFGLEDTATGPDEPIFLHVRGDSREEVVARATLYRKESLRAPDTNSDSPSEETVSSAPNQSSEAAARRTISGRVTATCYVSRYGWPYTSSSDHDWSNPSMLACGLRASVPWKVLARGGAAASLRDFAADGAVGVRLGEGLDLRIADRLELAFFVGDEVLSLDLANLTYAWGDDRYWSETLKGREVYSLLETEVVDR